MSVLLEAALPPAAVARELAAYLPARAPGFYAWLRRAAGELETIDLRQTGCTAAEWWQLRCAGFQAQPGQNWSAGLGPWRAAQARPTERQVAAQPVWLADLVHLALGAQQTRLLDALVVSETENQALLAAAVQAMLDLTSELSLDAAAGSGITFSPLAPGRWRVHLPAGLHPVSFSPALLASGQLDDWWPQDAHSRPWRRVVNSIQMAWHEHPLNAARSARGEPVINGLWLYGGAQPWAMPAAAAMKTYDELAAPARAGDWAAWLEVLAGLDARVLAPLLAEPEARLTLAGTERILTLHAPRGLARWLPGNFLSRHFLRRPRAWSLWCAGAQAVVSRHDG